MASTKHDFHDKKSPIFRAFSASWNQWFAMRPFICNRADAVGSADLAANRAAGEVVGVTVGASADGPAAPPSTQ